jgi:hypothetical protein
MSMSMSKITDCEVTECSYNSDKKCHTIAITVGDSNCPMCDTFVKMGKKGGDPDTIGGVGACRAEACRYNASLECSAGSIHVGMHGGHADCMTFSAK